MSTLRGPSSNGAGPGGHGMSMCVSSVTRPRCRASASGARESFMPAVSRKSAPKGRGRRLPAVTGTCQIARRRRLGQRNPPMLTFWFSPGASSMATHIALHEVGAQFDARPLSFSKKENKTPEFLALNPEGKVPTMSIDGHVLTEVAGSLFYLARRFPEAGLLPAGDIEA